MPAPKPPQKWTLSWLLAIDEHYTRGDKILTGSVFGWSIFWYIVSLVILVWNLFTIFILDKWRLLDWPWFPALDRSLVV